MSSVIFFRNNTSILFSTSAEFRYQSVSAFCFRFPFVFERSLLIPPVFYVIVLPSLPPFAFKFASSAIHFFEGLAVAITINPAFVLVSHQSLLSVYALSPH